MAVAENHPGSRALTFVASDVAPIGGMERATFEIGRRLLDRGWRVTVIARSCTLERRPELRFVRIPSPSRPVSLALICDFLFASFALTRHRSGLVQTNNATIANRVDIVHAQFCEAVFKDSGISRSSRPNLPYRLNTWIASWFARCCERWSYRPKRVRQVVCASQGLARDTARSYPPVRDLITTIPNGVDMGRFTPSAAARERVRAELGLGADDLVALFVGGDWHRKGLRHAIAGIAGAPGWSLVVVGAGDRDSFGRLAGELGVGGRVRFAGHVADPASHFLAADALVAPSYFEAFSLVALEGAAAGLPLIVPAMNGTEELVRDGVNGWFTPREGGAIAERLRRLQEDPELRARMGTAARASAEEYDWERIVDRFESVYGELGAAG